jgi:hypothetical protein
LLSQLLNLKEEIKEFRKSFPFFQPKFHDSIILEKKSKEPAFETQNWLMASLFSSLECLLPRAYCLGGSCLQRGNLI